MQTRNALSSGVTPSPIASFLYYYCHSRKMKNKQTNLLSRMASSLQFAAEFIVTKVTVLVPVTQSHPRSVKQRKVKIHLIDVCLCEYMYS